DGATVLWTAGEDAVGQTTNSVTVSPSTTQVYTVEVTLNGCTTTASTTVYSNEEPASPTCVNVYVTNAGTGDGTVENPANLSAALGMITCAEGVIKMQVGQYDIDAPITVPSNVTLEGGYLSNWTKTSTTGILSNTTIINRTANGSFPWDGLATPEAPALIALDINSQTNFRLQDLTITTANAPSADAIHRSGVSTYGIRMVNCNNYQIVRCRILPGNASNGVNGANGNNGTAGGNGSAGAAGGQCSLCNSTGGAGGSGTGAAPCGFFPFGPCPNGDNGITGQPGLISGGPGGAGGNGFFEFVGGGCDNPTFPYDGSNGTAGTNGSNGSNGSNGTVTYSSGYFVP
ncbi:MAG TPA: hypothetical protein PKD56_15340, partial [Chitinophagales bacterium]|nr:hypothetical protein [Chitinophagales bacterium]